MNTDGWQTQSDTKVHLAFWNHSFYTVCIFKDINLKQVTASPSIFPILLRRLYRYLLPFILKSAYKSQTGCGICVPSNILTSGTHFSSKHALAVKYTTNFFESAGFFMTNLWSVNQIIFTVSTCILIILIIWLIEPKITRCKFKLMLDKECTNLLYITKNDKFMFLFLICYVIKSKGKELFNYPK
jgi:hypothetical protein